MKQDNEDIFTDFIKCGQDVTSQRCKKCEFEELNEGLPRRHKVRVHDIKESKQNIIQRYGEVLENIDIIIVNIATTIHSVMEN